MFLYPPGFDVIATDDLLDLTFRASPIVYESGFAFSRPPNRRFCPVTDAARLGLVAATATSKVTANHLCIGASFTSFAFSPSSTRSFNNTATRPRTYLLPSCIVHKVIKSPTEV